jgi:hypothetical protein
LVVEVEVVVLGETVLTLREEVEVEVLRDSLQEFFQQLCYLTLYLFLLDVEV